MLSVLTLQAARTPDANGALPLHVACASGASREVLEVLVSRNQEALQCADTAGRLPLHFGAASGGACAPDAFAWLLDCYPGAARVRDASGSTPLHAACASGAPLHVVAALTSLGGAAAVRDRGPAGGAALHVASSRGAPASVVEHLLVVAPDAAACLDAAGALPLHAAAEACACGEVMAALMRAHPSGCAVLCGGLRPLTAWLCAQDGAARREVHKLTAVLVGDGALAASVVHELAGVAEAASALRAATDAHPTLPEALEPEPLSAPGPRLSALQVACPAVRCALLSAGRLLRRFALPQPLRATQDARLLLTDDASAPPGAFHRRVALKVLRRRDRFDRELARRTALGGPACEGVLPILASLTGAGVNADVAFAEEAGLRGLWPHIIILPRADASLAQALASRPDAHASPGAGRDWRAARLLTRALAEAVEPLHAAGLLHANLSPHHFLRCGDSLGGSWKLIDLDAGVWFHRGEYISDRVSPAYAPPELLRIDGDSVAMRCVAERGVLDAWEPGSLKAAVSYDMWGLGCLIYHTVVGRPLWEDAMGSDGEQLPDATLLKLARWDSAALEQKLEPLVVPFASPDAGPAGLASPRKASRDAVAAAAAASLLQLLLHPVAAKRPSAVAQILAHPFLHPAGGTLHAERSTMETGATPPSSPLKGAVAGLLSAVTSFNISLMGTGTVAAAKPASGGAALGPPPTAFVGPFSRTGLDRMGAGVGAAASDAWAPLLPPPKVGTVAATRSLVGVPALPGGSPKAPPSPGKPAPPSLSLDAP